jgi:hypothetical protein
MLGAMKLRRTWGTQRLVAQGLCFGQLLSAWSLSVASFIAVSSASAALTGTSGVTPVPSQSVLVMGLMARAKGTPMMK